MGYTDGNLRNGMQTQFSIWEIAHRWHGIPSLSSEQTPDVVLDLLRRLLHAAIEDYEASYENTKKVYDHLSENFGATKAQSLLDSINTGKPNVSGLKKYLLDYGSIASFCHSRDIPLPDFWFVSETPRFQPKLKDSQEDRIRCRTIAAILWEQNPNLTIPEISKHDWIQKHGNAAQYKGKDTVRNWVKDLAPNRKPGRPPKAKK